MNITTELINQVWEKGIVVPNYPKDIIRKDACGAWIVKDQYSKEESSFGWEIDHIMPKSMLIGVVSDESKIDNILNLRPFNIANNKSKKGDYPSYHASVKANGEFNIHFGEEKIVRPEIQNQLSEFFEL